MGKSKEITHNKVVFYTRETRDLIPMSKRNDKHELGVLFEEFYNDIIQF